MASVARYSRFVSFGKRFLWLLIAGVLGLVIWIASRNTGEQGSRLVFSNITQNADMQNVMVNPRYQGLDAKNQPYTVIADIALQKDKENVELSKIRAEMTQNNGVWLALNAGSGEINTASRKMELKNGVEVFYDSGYELHSASAFVDIHAGSAYGNEKVTGQARGGTLEADRFEVIDRGRVIRFNGSVRMTLYPQK